MHPHLTHGLNDGLWSEPPSYYESKAIGKPETLKRAWQGHVHSSETSFEGSGSRSLRGATPFVAILQHEARSAGMQRDPTYLSVHEKLR